MCMPRNLKQSTILTNDSLMACGMSQDCACAGVACYSRDSCACMPVSRASYHPCNDPGKNNLNTNITHGSLLRDIICLRNNLYFTFIVFGLDTSLIKCKGKPTNYNSKNIILKVLAPAILNITPETKNVILALR